VLVLTRARRERLAVAFGFLARSDVEREALLYHGSPLSSRTIV